MSEAVALAAAEVSEVDWLSHLVGLYALEWRLAAVVQVATMMTVSVCSSSMSGCRRCRRE